MFVLSRVSRDFALGVASPSGGLPAGPTRLGACVPKLETHLPVGVLLGDEVDFSVTSVGWPRQKLRALKDLQLRIDGALPGRISEQLHQVDHAHGPRQLCDRGPDLDPVLASEEDTGQLSGWGQVYAVSHEIYDLKSMDSRPWITLLGQIIAAGDVKRIPARVSWPLHAALKELHCEAGRLGLLGQLSVRPEFDPAPEAGLRARGADQALIELRREGVLRCVGENADATLEVDRDFLVYYSRLLMTVEPEIARLLQRAGSRWAALSSTVLKNSATPAESFRPTVASFTASRHEVAPAFL
jgi:hypothetical protein